MAVSARYGPIAKSDITITARLDANKFIHLTDHLTRLFIGGPFQTAVSSAHREASDKVQLAMARQLTRASREHVASTGRYRPHRPGDRLLSAIIDERNREATVSGFRVGIPSWYDQSPAALYWRPIEEGMDSFPGVILLTNGPPIGSPTGKRYAPRAAPTAHMRMPQHQGATVADIGPYPAYRYNAAGQRTAAGINYFALYMKYLEPIGLKAQIRGV